MSWSLVDWNFALHPYLASFHQGWPLWNSHSQWSQNSISKTYIYLCLYLSGIPPVYTHTRFRIVLLLITSYLDYVVFYFSCKTSSNINYPSWLVCLKLSPSFSQSHSCIFFLIFSKKKYICTYICKYTHMYIHSIALMLWSASRYHSVISYFL